MADYKPGDTLAKWTAEDSAPYVCNESAPAEKTNGDNPPTHVGSVDLPDEGDLRIKDTAGANPYPAMPGAGDAHAAELNPGLRPKGQPYTGKTL